jgi:hydroxymethylbilane synthase
MGFSRRTVEQQSVSSRIHLELATRGSDLALWQAHAVREQLTQHRIEVDLVEVETTGDEVREELIHRLGTTGAFVRSLDERVLAGDLDGSVHSMKDMPTDQPDELVVAGVPERGPPGDVLVTPNGTSLADLPEGATVGTASLRRGAQLHATRPDLTIEGLRGNVDTRVEKLLAPSLQREHERRLETAGELEPRDGESDGNESPEGGDSEEDGEQSDSGESGDATSADGNGGERDSGADGDTFEQSPQEWFDSLAEIERQALGRAVDVEYDAICLAAAGLERSGLLRSLSVEHLDPTEFVPAPAQGTIAVTALDGEIAGRIRETIDHPPTRVVVTVERTILDELGGGCVAPIGVYGRLQGGVVTTVVRVLDREGTEEIHETRELPVERHAEAAREFADELAGRGAAELIERARREEPDEPKREGAGS